MKSAQLAGASQVIGIDPTLSRRQRALSFGATHVFTPEEALHAIRELTDVRGVDHLIEAAGVKIQYKQPGMLFKQGGIWWFWGKCSFMGMLAYAEVP